MQDERELTVELERKREGEEIGPIRVAPDDLEPDTLRAVIESFVLREGTDYGVRETALEDKVAQVLIQLRRGEAHITFDPATESINVVVTNAISDQGRPSVGTCHDLKAAGVIEPTPFAIGSPTSYAAGTIIR